MKKWILHISILLISSKDVYGATQVSSCLVVNGAIQCPSLGVQRPSQELGQDVNSKILPQSLVKPFFIVIAKIFD